MPLAHMGCVEHRAAFRAHHPGIRARLGQHSAFATAKSPCFRQTPECVRRRRLLKAKNAPCIVACHANEPFVVGKMRIDQQDSLGTNDLRRRKHAVVVVKGAVGLARPDADFLLCQGEIRGVFQILRIGRTGSKRRGTACGQDLFDTGSAAYHQHALDAVEAHVRKAHEFVFVCNHGIGDTALVLVLLFRRFDQFADARKVALVGGKFGRDGYIGPACLFRPRRKHRNSSMPKRTFEPPTPQPGRRPSPSPRQRTCVARTSR